MATKSIGTTGRDYSTVALWLASLPATLTEAEIGECYNDSEFAENIALGAGITTSGSNTLTLRAAAGQGIADHADKDTNPLVYDQSKGVGFRTTDAVILLNTSSANTVVEGLQFFKDQSGYGNVVLQCPNSSASGTTTIKNCLIQRTNSAAGGNAMTVTRYATLVNCILIHKGTHRLAASIRAGGGAGTGTLRNCTIVGAGSGAAMGVQSDYGTTAVVANTAVFGFSTAITGTFDGTNSKNNCTDLAAFPGTNNLTSKTFANQFVSTTVDFRVKAGADLINAGVQDAATSDLDILERARSASTPTIGAWEFQAAGDVSITAGLGSLVAAGFAPTAVVTAHGFVAAGLGALTLIGLAPSLSATTNVSVTTGLGALVLTGLAPSDSTTANVAITTGLGALTFTGFMPIQELGSPAPGVGQLVFSGHAPSLQIGGPVGITSGLGQLTLTASIPTLSVSDHKAVSAGLATLALSSSAPTVDVSLPNNINAGRGELTLTGYAPSLDASESHNITAGLAALAIGSAAPTLEATAHLFITAEAGGIIVTGFAPGAFVGATQAVDAGLGELSLTGYAPSIEHAGTWSIQAGLAQLVINSAGQPRASGGVGGGVWLRRRRR